MKKFAAELRARAKCEMSMKYYTDRYRCRVLNHRSETCLKTQLMCII